jgi:hypothetical protein
MTRRSALVGRQRRSGLYVLAFCKETSTDERDDQTASPKVFSDVTPASGWILLDCDSTIADQDIRLLCINANYDEAGCSHVMQEGVDGTVVRLPETVRLCPFFIPVRC